MGTICKSCMDKMNDEWYDIWGARNGPHSDRSAVGYGSCNLCGKDTAYSKLTHNDRGQDICEECLHSSNIIECKTCGYWGTLDSVIDGDFYNGIECQSCYNDREAKDKAARALVGPVDVSYYCESCNKPIPFPEDSRSLCAKCTSKISSNLLGLCKECGDVYTRFSMGGHISDICKFCIKVNADGLCRVCGKKSVNKLGLCREHMKTYNICPNCNLEPIRKSEVFCETCKHELHAG